MCVIIQHAQPKLKLLVKERIMSDKEITCSECEAEFQVIHDNITDPEFCPFCGSKLRYEDDGDWYDDDDDGAIDP
jgi:rRNA maturation endonuclease Nob1